MSPALRRKRVVLRTETAEGLPEVQVDSAKLRQVLVNLMQNAAEAMAERGGNVTVRASHYPREAAVVVAVEDDGPGIPAEDLRTSSSPSSPPSSPARASACRSRRASSSTTAAASRSTPSRAAARPS